MRIGVDWGGGKIKAIVLDDAGAGLLRRRVATPIRKTRHSESSAMRGTAALWDK